MRKLLIHANNTSLNTEAFFGLSEEFFFDIDIDKDVDEYINDKLNDPVLKIKILESDLLFIKLSLSSNYLEFLGLRVAYHIRLTECLGEKKTVPIIFIGEETYEFLAKFAPEPSILFTRGIYLIPDSKAGYQHAEGMYHDQSIQRSEEITQLISRLNLRPPTDHLSEHSITNEWSILRWAGAMGVESNIEFSRIRHRIEQSLHYKYLKYKFPVPEHFAAAAYQIKGVGKVLLIDDEWENGWGILFKQFFKGSRINFSILQNSFKDKEASEIVTMCDREVKAIDPDIVILDLRLIDDDVNKNLGSLLSGHQVLESIKKINPGIQVIILTASNKIWNLTGASLIQPDGFILKESPELSADPSYSKRSIEEMASLIEKSLLKSFLKNVHIKREQIVQLTDVASYSGDLAFIGRLKTNLAVSFKLLDDAIVSSKYFNYSYLQLFQIIEDFTKQDKVFYEDDQCIVYVKNKEVVVRKIDKPEVKSAMKFENGKYIIKANRESSNRKSVDTNFKVSAILIFRYGNVNSSVKNWTQISSKRNTIVAHYNSDETVSSTDIMELMNFIFYFINDDNQADTNVLAGLKGVAFEDKIQALTQKFNPKN